MRHVTAGLLVLALVACRDTGVPGELGRSQDDYVVQYGQASTSTTTPDQVGFSPAPGTRLVVRFVDGRSVEELWILDADDTQVPATLAQRGRRLMTADKPPIRSFAFQTEGQPSVAVFEEPAGKGVLRVERRDRRLGRIALCVDPAACRMLDYLEQGEQATDKLMAAAAAAMRKEGRH